MQDMKPRRSEKENTRLQVHRFAEYERTRIIDSNGICFLKS